MLTRTSLRILLASMAMVGLVSISAADSVVCYDIDYDDVSNSWTYHYRYTTDGTLTQNVSTWELTDLANIDTAAPGDNWNVDTYTSTYVRYVYIGPTGGTGTYETFDVIAYAPPGTVTWNSDGSTGDPPYTGQVTGPIPEPSSMLLLLFGLGIAGFGIKRRKIAALAQDGRCTK